jgi:hypothetical protein
MTCENLVADAKWPRASSQVLGITRVAPLGMGAETQTSDCLGSTEAVDEEMLNLVEAGGSNPGLVRKKFRNSMPYERCLHPVPSVCLGRENPIILGGSKLSH